MLESLKDALKRSIPYEVVKYRHDLETRRAWDKQGRPPPLPHIIKQLVIKYYARSFRTSIFVETGTYVGDMVHAVRKQFSRIISFELHQTPCAQGQKRSAADSHVEIIHGDSGKLLGDYLNSIDQPCLFWLDGHYSGGVTAKGALFTPIKNELDSILSHPIEGHVVLIDDARCFTGDDDYPTLDELRTFVAERKPGWLFTVETDVIRLHEPHK